MEEAATILVIMNSVVLAILLIICIVLAVAVTKLVKSLQRIAIKAEDFVDDAEAAVDAVKSVSGPVSALKLIQNIVSMVNDNKKRKK